MQCRAAVIGLILPREIAYPRAGMQIQDMLLKYLNTCWQVTEELAPWLFLGAFAAGLLHVLLPRDFIRRHLGGRGFGSAFKAALIGVPMPLCSCGVIPAGIALKKEGASDAAAVAFLISTPQTGVDSIAVSAAFLGWPFAIFKVVSAFLTGLLGGTLADAGRPAATPETGASAAPAAAEPVSFTARLRELVAFGANELLRGIWRWVAAGILVSAAISVLLPDGSLGGRAWATGFTGMLAMLAISVPMYVCATGSVPIAAALVRAGMSPGAALVFLMAGPATNVATLGAVYKVFGRRVTGIYLAVIVVSSLVLGWVFDSLLQVRSSAPAACHAPVAGWLSTAMAAALLLLFAWFMLDDLRAWYGRRRAAAAGKALPAAAQTLLLQVSGMTCEGCANRVRACLTAAPGVLVVQVDLAAAKVSVGGSGMDAEDLCSRLRQAGYGALPVDGDETGNGRR